ncbi:hypothetical protein ORM92_23040 [Bacillus cereus]|uniref:hypothetical protein n=1 Tax=Bacillus cereus TaxID=1396 RepID=UPI002ABFD736|nr:hypothetical protein [Bacillus cereus]MDZ4406731.1 hypothetical protein [Bacillus cereus]MDZ4533967.1 hypothetical protein [Bacillus cereus]
MKKPIINLISFASFIVSMVFFIIATQKSYIDDVTGREYGFGYGATASIFFILGIIIVCIRLGVVFIKNQKQK